MRTTTIHAWMTLVAESVKDQRDYLTQLDAAIGDGDHGVNMDRGFDAVGKALAGQDGSVPPGKLLTLAGKTLVSTVGGASGPLWGTAFRRAGRALGDARGVRRAGPARARSAPPSTAWSSSAPPSRATRRWSTRSARRSTRSAAALDAGEPLERALAAATEAAEEGARATVPLQARKGRASYLGERSIGHQDPGATSAALIMAALQRAVEREG